MPQKLNDLLSTRVAAQEGALARRSRICKDLDRAGYRVPLFSLTVYRLAHLSLPKYEKYLGFLTQIRAEIPNRSKLNLFLPPVERLNSMEVDFLKENSRTISESFYFENRAALDLSKLPSFYYEMRDTILLREIRGSKADRTPLPLNGAVRAELARLAPVAPPLLLTGARATLDAVSASRLSNLAQFLGAEDVYLDKIADNPEATIDKLFHSLDHAAGKLRALGFLNVAVYRPKNDGSGEWVLTHATREYGESGFSQGSVPNAGTSTIGWIIKEGRGKRVRLYDVDIYEPSTFEALNIPYHQDKAENDRRLTLGSGRTLFIRLASSYGDEAIVQIHNRVLRKPGKSEPPAPLPEDPSEANRIITLLGLYFKGEVLPAIEKIRGRGDEGAARAGSAVSELDAVVGPTAELVKIGAAKRATAEVKMDALDLNALPSIQHRRFVPMPVLILWHRIRLIFRGLIDRLIRRWQAKEPLKLTDFYNREGARVKAYLDYPEKVDDPRNVPWVIIPPAFGKTKETSFLLSLYLKKNGFGALRYDDSCSVGESEGEIYDLTLSGSTANILAAVDYLSINIKPRSIGLVPFSLSARPAIKAASLDERINFLLPIVGSPNVESLLSRVYGENLVGDYQAGVRKGALNLLGHIVDSDKFLGDTARAGYAGLASTLSDMNNVKIPIIWSCGSEDPWVDVAEVQQVLNVNPAGAQREIKTYRGLSHRVREAGKAPEIFAEVVRQIISLATGQAVSSDEIIHPQDNEIVKRGVLERHRISRRLSREEEVHNWNKYLEGFDILLETRDYMDYLELMWKHLEIRPGDNVLDVGCGNGNFLTLSLDRMALQMDKSGWSRGVMTGVDFVEEALGRAAQRIDKIKVKRKDLPALELQKLDVEQGELPHQHEFYDKIVASLFLSYLQKPEEAVKKICERLKKGGSIVLTSLKPDADVSQIYFRFMEKLKADHPRADQKEMIERARNLLNSAMGWIEVEEESGRFKYLSAAELENMLRANGIEIVASTRSFGDQAVVVVGKKPL